jgi:hypothetical protein
MQRLVIIIVSLHWCALFALMTLYPASFFSGAVAVPLAEFERGLATTALGSAAGLGVLLILTMALLCSALFLWVFLSALTGGVAAALSICGPAFTAATGMMTGMLVVEVMGGAELAGLAWATLELIALFASYILVGPEHLRRSTPVAAEENEAAGGAMARSAARQFMLSRLSGRRDAAQGGAG